MNYVERLKQEKEDMEFQLQQARTECSILVNYLKSRKSKTDRHPTVPIDEIEKLAIRIKVALEENLLANMKGGDNEHHD